MAGSPSSSSSSAPSTSSSKGWLSNISSIASRIYFFLIILQIPLFRSGMCTTPLHVTSSQLIASEIFPIPVVKALLYPGAVVNGVVTSMTIPSWDNLLNIYNLTSAKEAPAVADLQRLEVLAGSYFSVAGAIVCLLKPGRMTMFGTLLIIWGLVKEGILGKPANTDPAKAVYVYPTMVLALFCAFSSVKYDLKKVARSAPARPVAKPLRSSTKSKLK
ncbi:uncharacterized protein LOC133823414 isoform X2 [Humulus lupulus]|uniref:uncharacterized protein LOC133823414 isoform X2 n=1 Tax=Humulus lupulus TaxID=3486 RepID=UPI002B40F93B|nr:uncharacterized protein LOC133823414 isoform X2 [Humulus lupulus]